MCACRDLHDALCCSLVTQVKVFGNQLGQAGGEALAQALESNTTLEEVSVGNLIMGSTVRLKEGGETKVLTSVASDGDVKYYGSGGWVKPSNFDSIPAVLPVKQLRDNAIAELDFKNSGLGVDGGIMLAAVLKKNASVTKVSAILSSDQWTTTSSQRAMLLLFCSHPGHLACWWPRSMLSSRVMHLLWMFAAL